MTKRTLTHGTIKIPKVRSSESRYYLVYRHVIPEIQPKLEKMIDRELSTYVEYSDWCNHTTSARDTVYDRVVVGA